MTSRCRLFAIVALFTFAAGFFLSSSVAAPPDNAYIGADACALCHKEIYEAWKGSGTTFRLSFPVRWMGGEMKSILKLIELSLEKGE